MELCLWVALDSHGEGTFQVFNKLWNKEETFARDSILVVDYDWTPWIREGGNLLWS